MDPQGEKVSGQTSLVPECIVQHVNKFNLLFAFSSPKSEAVVHFLRIIPVSIFEYANVMLMSTLQSKMKFTSWGYRVHSNPSRKLYMNLPTLKKPFVLTNLPFSGTLTSYLMRGPWNQ